ncbi:ABC transporter permease subunit [Niallia sp. 01092]|uniref:ABC transporter permease subunit n=1 Tax=unclassified Niallia TaxID=2837522 RepID=UPI003FD678E7
MDFDFAFMFKVFLAAVKYLPTTLLLGFLPLILGSILGLIIALVRFFNIPVLSSIFKWFVTIFKAIPVVLILLVAYLVSADLLDKIAQTFSWSIRFKDIDRRWIAIFALTLYATSGLSEVFRGSLAAIPKGQFDAAYSIGLTKSQLIRRMVIPQVIPIAFPMINSTLIGLIKTSSLVSMVSVVDILDGAIIEANANYRFLEAYVAVSLIYWSVCAAIEGVSTVYENHFNRGKRRRLV